MRLLLILPLVFMLGCGSDLAPTTTVRADTSRESPFSTCSLLSDQEWETLLGRPYYGPEQEDSWSTSGEVFTSQCTYNFAQIALRRPATAGDVKELHAELEMYLKGRADSDAEQGFDWAVHVESVDSLGVPAVLGRVSDADGLGMYYLRALTGTGAERTLLEVASAEDAAQATHVAARILAAL